MNMPETALISRASRASRLLDGRLGIGDQLLLASQKTQAIYIPRFLPRSCVEMPDTTFFLLITKISSITAFTKCLQRKLS
jgi:hypothetical protein